MNPRNEKGQNEGTVLSMIKSLVKGDNHAEGSTSNAQRNLLLGFLKAACVLPTQPLHVVMRWQQAQLGSAYNASVLSAAQSFRILWGLKTPDGQYVSKATTFYKGLKPAMTKEFLKNAIYKGFLITNAPNYVDWLFADSLGDVMSPGQYTFFRAVAAGCFAGLGDNIAGGIPEFMATRGATSHGAGANVKLIGDIQFSKTPIKAIAALYTGFIPSVLKGSVAFSTLFYTSEPIKKYTKQLYGIEEGQPVPFVTNLTASFFSGLTVSSTTAALDNAKTQSQMPNSKGKSVIQTLRDNVSKFGPRSLVVGLPLRTVISTLGWGVSHFVLLSHHSPKPERPASAAKEQTLARKM